VGLLAFPRVGSYRSRMTILAIGFACVALGVAVYAALRVHRLSIGSDTPQVQPYDDGDVWTALEGVANEIPGLRAEYAEFKAMVTTAVAEGIQHVERAENRIKATVRRARRELEDGGVRSPGLEAEARDLFDDDAGGGPSEAVLSCVGCSGPRGSLPRAPFTNDGEESCLEA